MKLEVCIDSLETALIAEKAGADRIELCGDLSVGGITPNLKLISEISENIQIPIMMMVRPRRGNFNYSDEEFNSMKDSIKLAKKHKFQGVVIGLLDHIGNIDKVRTKQLLELSRPLEVTFHRAFDQCNNPIESLSYLIDIGIDRLLTSGQENVAIEGVKLISKLVSIAQKNIIVMPGSGISSDNINKLMLSTNAKEFHGSFKGDDGKTNANIIKTVRQYLNI